MESDELLIEKTKQLQITKIICWSFYFRPLKSFILKLFHSNFPEQKISCIDLCPLPGLLASSGWGCWLAGRSSSGTADLPQISERA